MTFQVPPGATEVTIALTISEFTILPLLQFTIPPSEVHVEDEGERDNHALVLEAIAPVDLSN